MIEQEKKKEEEQGEEEGSAATLASVVFLRLLFFSCGVKQGKEGEGGGGGAQMFLGTRSCTGLSHRPTDANKHNGAHMQPGRGAITQLQIQSSAARQP